MRYDDVIVGAGPLSPGGPVKVLDGLTGAVRASLFSFPGFFGGVSAGSVDRNRDGLADIIVGAGAGASGGHVKVFNGLTLALVDSYFAFPFPTGVFVGGVGR